MRRALPPRLFNIFLIDRHRNRADRAVGYATPLGPAKPVALAALSG